MVHKWFVAFEIDFKVNIFFVRICLILKVRELHGFINDLSVYSDDNYLGHNNQNFR